VVEIVKRAHQQKPDRDGIRRSRWAAVRNTYPQLRDTTIRTVFDWLPEKHFGLFKKGDHEYIVDGFTGVEIEILFRALDRPEHVSNLLSLELTGAWVNEAKEVPWAIVDALQGRVDRYPSRRDGIGPTWAGIIMDTNPPDDLSGWFRYFEELRPKNAAIFKQPSGLSDEAENLPALSATYYENLAEGKDPEFVKVYVDGEYGFVVEGKPVFPEYNDHIHCRPCTPTHGRPLRRGWDFGLTPAVTISQLQVNGQWFVVDEMCAERAGIDRFSDEVLVFCAEKYPNFEWIDTGDPAGADPAQTDERTCFEILQGKGVRIQGGERTLLRLESVRKPLSNMVDGSPGFLLDPSCRILRRGFMGGYNYKRMQIGGVHTRYHEKPDKNQYSHPHDALQYDASKLFGKEVRGRKARKWAPLEFDTRGFV
jgi:hypothetical protein